MRSSESHELDGVDSTPTAVAMLTIGAIVALIAIRVLFEKG